MLFEFTCVYYNVYLHTFYIYCIEVLIANIY